MASESIHLLEPMSAGAFVVAKGATVSVIDVAGGQPGDLVVFDANDHRVRHAAARSRVENGSVRPTTGDVLWSGGPSPIPLMTITADTAPAHDLLYPPCCRFALRKRFGVDRDGCMEHLLAALEPHGVALHDLPDPLNLFFHVNVTDAGQLSLGAHRSPPGAAITLRAETDCLIAVSTCSVPIEGRDPTGYRIEIR